MHPSKVLGPVEGGTRAILPDTAPLAQLLPPRLERLRAVFPAAMPMARTWRWVELKHEARLMVGVSVEGLWLRTGY